MEIRERQAELERLEQDRIAQRKKVEMQRIAELRRQEQRERPEEIINGEDETNNISASTNSLTKSNSVAHMFGDRIRRGQDGIKRAESMKVGQKPVKRTPSFTTRRRGSLRSMKIYFLITSFRFLNSNYVIFYSKLNNLHL